MTLKADWSRIEKLFRAGLLSTVEISRETGVPESTIRYQAKQRRWRRDLTEQVKVRTRGLLIQNLAKQYDANGLLKDLKDVDDEQIMEEAARTQVNVVRDHQKTLGHGHRLTLRMLSELDASTSNLNELQEMIEEATKGDKNHKRRDAMMRAVSLGGRASTMRDLAQAARLWVTLERQAFSINENDKRDDKQPKLDEMTAEQIRAELVRDAKALGLQLSSLEQGLGAAADDSAQDSKVRH